jgi:hypothetical protein
MCFLVEPGLFDVVVSWIVVPDFLVEIGVTARPAEISYGEL